MVELKDAVRLVNEQHEHGVYFHSAKLHLEFSSTNYEVCPSFSLTGKCDKNGSCGFSHDRALVKFCVNWKVYGSCQQGDKCPFGHTIAPVVAVDTKECQNAASTHHQVSTSLSGSATTRPADRQTHDANPGGYHNVTDELAVIAPSASSRKSARGFTEVVTPTSDAQNDESPSCEVVAEERVESDGVVAGCVTPDHDIDITPINTSIVPAPLTRLLNRDGKEVCPILVATGACDKWGVCRYSHDKGALNFCAKWRATGSCIHGRACRFPHPPVTNSVCDITTGSPVLVAAATLGTRVTDLDKVWYADDHVMACLPIPDCSSRLTALALATRNKGVNPSRTRPREEDSVVSEYSCSSTERYCHRRRIRHRPIEYYKERSGVICGEW
jgi:hypothetical protein